MRIIETHNKFGLYLTALSISQFGSMLSFFAIPLIVYSMYHSGVILSMFEMISVVIGITFSIPFGFWLRKKNLKNFWILFLIILGISGFVVFFWFNIFTLIYYNIICIFLFIGIGIIQQSLIPNLVSKDKIVWANNTIFLAIIAIGIITPFAGGFILTLSWRLPFLIDAITYFIEVGIVMFISVPSISSPATSKRESTWRAFKTSLSYISENKVIKCTLILEILTMIIGGGIKILNIAYFSYAQDPYILYGIASTIIAIGMSIIIIPVTLKAITIKNSYRMIILSLILYSSFFVGIFITWHSIYAIFLFLILGLGNGFISPNLKATIQKYTKREYLTQIIGINQTLNSGSRFLSLVIMGILVDTFNLAYIYLSFGLLLLVLFIAFYPTIKYTSVTNQ